MTDEDDPRDWFGTPGQQHEPGMAPPTGPAPAEPTGGFEPPPVYQNFPAPDPNTRRVEAPYPLPTAPRKAKPLLLVFIGIMLVASLLIGGCVYLLVTGVGNLSGAANDHLRLVSAGQLDEAYDALDPDCQGSREAHAERMAPLIGADFNMTSSTYNNGERWAGGTYVLAGESTKRDMIVTINKIGDDLFVCQVQPG